MSAIEKMLEVTIQCRRIDFSEVSRDQAVGYIHDKCRGMTAIQMATVVKNVLGAEPGQIECHHHQAESD